MRHRATIQGLALAVLLAFAAACGGPATTAAPPAAPDATDAPAAQATEAPAAAEPVTLTFWWEGAAVGNLEIFQKSFDRYQEMNPHVTIEVLAIPFEDMLRTFPLALDGGTGPDISMSLPLESTTFPAAKAGHLLDLTEIGAERGWFDRYDTKALDVNNRGLGGIYGVPYEWTVVGVYYNTEIFADLGLEPPETFAEFEQQLATIKAAGITPISVGGKDGWPLDHVWQQMVHTNVEYAVLRALEDRDPNASWEHPRLIEAAAKVQEWTELGYLDPNLLSTGFVDANDLFINGEAAMNVGGTWVQSDFRGAEFEARFFPMPRMRTDIEAHLGGFTPANDIVIIKNSPRVDAALDLLDYLLSEENMTMWWQSGLLVPYRFDPLPPGRDQLQADIYGAMQANGPGHFITVSAPETNRVLWAALQDLVAFEKSPEAVFAEVQQTYEVEVASN